jgi:murein DD-endopeptidase MepM/ murein hydrolase activator NlpD
MLHFGSLDQRSGALFLFLTVQFVGVGALGAEDGAATPDVPEKYFLAYPVADAFCPPIRTTFFEVTQTWGVVGGRRFRQKANGGYGLPVVDKVEDKHLIHLGADLGWYQVGEPVFAVAAGVVRVSDGPTPKPEKDGARPERGPTLAWGNLIVIEHRTANEEEFFTTIYGHLGADRLVKVGDVVEVGTQIGEIGKQNPLVNGGYKPHLHFGVREGRIVEKGMALFHLATAEGRLPVRVARLGEEEVELEVPEAARPRNIKVTLQGEEFFLVGREGKFFLPAKVLWRTRRSDFPIVGYGLSTEGWRDPVAFLREREADAHPPGFKLARPAKPPRR